MSHLDELAEKSESKKGELSGQLRKYIREVLQSGKIPAAASPTDSIVQGSIVGELTILIGVELFVIRFSVSDDFEESGFISPDSPFIRTSEGEEVEELMQMIVDEIKQLPNE